MLRLRHTLVDPAEIGRSLQTLWSIHHGMLTISVEATPGDRAFTRVAVRLAVEEVAVSILPGHHCLFTLSSQLGDRTDEVYCCLLYTSPSPRDVEESRMPSSA